ALARASIGARVGAAYFPRDGDTVALLCAAAGAALHGPLQRSPPVVVDPAMVELYELVQRVAVSDVNVLLLGETGVGKEVVATQLHHLSSRASGPLLCLNCAALPEALLESALFGHERGAFTGAVETKPGLLETAHEGTVLLDEIGEMPPAIQAKLL